VIAIVLWAFLAVLCVVWFFREAHHETDPAPADFAGVIRTEQKWMLLGFVVLVIGIALTS
jgi:heme/copper-type cytochrome/quinol oxidase subunit 2